MRHRQACVPAWVTASPASPRMPASPWGERAKSRSAGSRGDGERVAPAASSSPLHITACGGGARSGEWGRIFAGVLGRDVHVREDAVGIRGAARVAWRALGADSAAGGSLAGGRVARADEEAVAFYEDGYHRYLDTLEKARQSW